MKTSFRTQTDAFAFVNDWAYDDQEKNSIRAVLSGAVPGVAALLAPIYAPVLGLAVGASIPVDALVSLLTAGLIPPGTVTAAATTASITATSTSALITLLNGWLSNFFTKGFGLCGGMAYASLDYYRLGWVVPQGGLPDRSTQQSSALRDYIWKRLIDADLEGKVAPRTIEWMALLHFIPPQFCGGAPELLKRTKAEWEILKQHLECDGPWPIAIVGTTKNPTDNHQILAYGYEDNGDGTGLVYVYDNAADHPQNENTISIDFRFDELMTKESAYPDTGFESARGPLKGIFCSQYVPSIPPLALGLEKGLSSSISGPVQNGTSIALTFTAKNYGHGPTSDLALDSKGVSYGQPRVVYDVGEEVQRAPVSAGGDRQWSGQVTVAGSDWRRYMAAAHLGVFDGVDVWKNIPPSEVGTSNLVELATYASVVGATWLIEANGFSGQIQISSIDSAGRVAGTLFGNSMSGYWDEAARCLTMVRLIDAGNPSTFQYYTGYLFKKPDNYYALAGTFSAFAAGGADANRDEFGWLAEEQVIQ